MTKLTAHVTLEEATVTSTGLPNVPNEEQRLSLALVCEKVFEPVRNHFGVPLYISSGFRSEAVNRKVGGKSNSQHCKGEAIDIDADHFGKVTNAEIYAWIHDNLDYDQLIMEGGLRGWVHVSYKKSGNRKQAFDIPNP